MNDDFGNDYVLIEDEDGNEFELEHLDTFQFEGKTYMVFLPADMDENEEDFGYIFLVPKMEKGEEILVSIDDEDEEDRVYNRYMEMVFDEEE